MLKKRIIVCLDVRDGRVVKGVNFENLGDVASSVDMAKLYTKSGADELVFLDITASSDARNTVVDMVRRVAERVFIPFTAMRPYHAADVAEPNNALCILEQRCGTLANLRHATWR